MKNIAVSSCILVLVMAFAEPTLSKVSGPRRIPPRTPDVFRGNRNPVNTSLFGHSPHKRNQVLQADVFLGGGATFTMGLSLGSPPQSLNVTVALNSEFSWVACSPCVNCNQSNAKPLFQPGSTSSYNTVPCGSSLCSGFNEVSTSCGVSSNSCSYNSSGRSNFSTAGELATDILTMNSITKGGNIQTTRTNLSFGCGRDSGGLLGIFGTSGILGLDRSNESFIGQLSRTEFRSKFMYCISSDTLSGKFALGNYKFSNSSFSASMAYTPMITNLQATELYYINLISISIEDSRSQIVVQGLSANGTGGTILDTTVALSYLLSDSYDQLVQRLKNYTTNLVEVSSPFADTLGLELCYNISANSSDYPPPQELTFSFSGGVQVKVLTWFVLQTDGVVDTVCIALGRSETVGFSFNLVGTYHQLDLMVEYDLESSRYGFKIMEGCNQSLVLDNTYLPRNGAYASRKSLWVVLLLFSILSIY